MARKRARRPRDRAYRILKDRLTRVDPKDRDDLYAQSWFIIAYDRARRILGLIDEDPQDPEEDEG